ncbi:thiamine pyrophosphate-dependent enzyme (homolog to acetolactate synthase / benzoylformate decarboxylase) [Natrialba magadii ATCC 43099]|uniref:Thiamine pyrophosphate domain-containing TPP-binding protein n=1 Tax=Natrialba magadii (strain ATCC 43099 / DSM 3394 / CCM 3739 / CIP 104546 / IAM 13178 / JCM 8861 / NBRC 102185 / NCIMB 2190 / MS3) TaxID=547559 RepID=D3SVX2_NATMM|nr:thiamine pyrophosphate-binding protein [Natrialba magadii]ADD03691.1 thiamine pyrophosphate-dependent enzyme (homolog to acetolactate synthase / benzoylformate decarboxylase) [Natrialba magadii ATCC 43099]ELY34455.1 thiamine pyrophosphate domain-containing TPP-binding protein [Natrialba magadii ATCC 43099]
MTTSRTGAEYVVDALDQYGVEHLFGNPGTTELPVVQSLSDSSIEYVLGLHEDVAVGMASGYARTRRYHSHHDEDINPIGVANLHVAPGLAHGVGNVIGAYFAGSPLLVTAGNHSTDFQHEEPILSGDLEELVRQYTKWSGEVKSVEALPTMLRRAVRYALTPPTGPVFLALPLDVMLDETTQEVERLGEIPRAGRGDLDSIEAAADAIADATEPVVITGDEIARSGPDAVEAAVSFAESSGARVHGEFLPGEVSFPMDHPQWGHYVPGTESQFADLVDTDTVVLAGCSSLTTSIRHEEPLFSPETTIIQIGMNPRELGKNRPADVSVIGDPGAVMSELAAELETRISEDERRRRIDTVQEAIEHFSEQQRPAEADDDDPRASKGELGQAMFESASDAFLVNEGVTSSRAVRWHVPYGTEGKLSNKSGGLGYGLPAAIGAAIAERERPDPRDVVAFIGDGSYFYYPQSIYSAVRYDVDLTVIVANNNNYRILKDNTLRVLGGNEDEHDFVGMDFEPPLNITKNAESYGASSRMVYSPSEIASAIESARDQDGTTVLDVLVHD